MDARLTHVSLRSKALKCSCVISASYGKVFFLGCFPLRTTPNTQKAAEQQLFQEKGAEN